METVIKNYSNEQSLNESQEILLRSIGFEDVRTIIKTTDENTSDITLKFRKALDRNIFTPLILNEHRENKIKEYEKNAAKINFETEKEKDDYLLRLFTKWSINDLLEDKDRLSKTFEGIARYRNNEFISEDDKFNDIRSNLIYDTMYKYKNEEFIKPDIKVYREKEKEFTDCYNLKNGVWEVKTKYYDYTESIITEISDVKENDIHFISVKAVIIKTVYMKSSPIPCGKFMVHKNFENIFEVNDSDFTYFCTDMLQKNILFNSLPYFFTESDKIENYKKINNEGYLRTVKKFIENTELYLYGNDVAEYNHMYNIMLSEYVKMKKPEEKIFNLRFLSIFPLDMSKTKNLEVMSKIYNKIKLNEK